MSLHNYISHYSLLFSQKMRDTATKLSTIELDPPGGEPFFVNMAMFSHTVGIELVKEFKRPPGCIEVWEMISRENELSHTPYRLVCVHKSLLNK